MRPLWFKPCDATLPFLLLASAPLPTRLHVNPQTSPSPAHHRANGFQNNYIEFKPKSLLDVLKWRLDAVRKHAPPAAQTPTPTVAPDLRFIHANAGAGAMMAPAITWIGHATMLAQFGGLTLLTDPVFSDRASPLGFIGPKRRVAPGLALAELPHIDLVLISHNHYDHLDEASVRALAAQAGGPPLFIVPLGIKAWMTARGIGHVIELDWWQSHVMVPRASGRAGARPAVAPIEIVFVPAQHWSGRGLTDRMQTLWGGFAVFAPDLHFFFAGDTAYSRDFSDIRSRLASREGPGGGFDIALIPVGAYEPRWFMQSQHVDPGQAVQIHLDLNAKRSVGVHWGQLPADR